MTAPEHLAEAATGFVLDPSPARIATESGRPPRRAGLWRT